MKSIFRIHLSTAIALTFAASALLLANLYRPDVVTNSPTNFYSVAAEEVDQFAINHRAKYGWPFTGLEIVVTIYQNEENISNRNGFAAVTDGVWHSWKVVANVLIAFLILGCVARLLERRARRSDKEHA